MLDKQFYEQTCVLLYFYLGIECKCKHDKMQLFAKFKKILRRVIENKKLGVTELVFEL